MRKNKQDVSFIIKHFRLCAFQSKKLTFITKWKRLLFFAHYFDIGLYCKLIYRQKSVPKWIDGVAHLTLTMHIFHSFPRNKFTEQEFYKNIYFPKSDLNICFPTRILHQKHRNCATADLKLFIISFTSKFTHSQDKSRNSFLCINVNYGGLNTPCCFFLFSLRHLKVV